MTECYTMECDGVAVRYTSCDGFGKVPYCRECADVMIRSGEKDRGPVGKATILCHHEAEVEVLREVIARAARLCEQRDTVMVLAVLREAL